MSCSIGMNRYICQLDVSLHVSCDFGLERTQTKQVRSRKEQTKRQVQDWNPNLPRDLF